jgi:phage-related minor tail protein
VAKDEAKIKFTAETGEFNKSIKQANNEMSELRAELKLNETQMKNTGVTVEGLGQKHELLEKQLKASQEKTEALSEKAKKAAEIFGENSEQASKLRTQLANAQIAEEKARKAVDDCNKELEEQGRISTDLDGKLGKLAIGVAAVGAGMVALGKESIEAFNEVDEGADNVIKATGATGEAAAELEENYKNVASSIVGDFGDIGSTLGEVNTRFGFTGSEAEEATTKFLKFSEVTGMDGVSAVQAVSRAIESAGLKSSDYASVLDALTTAGQATGVSVDTLANALTENGAVMREMGYDTNTTIAMLAQFEKAGVDSNSVIRGMRTAIAKWSKDGLDAKTEFSKLVEGIKNGSVDAGEAYEAFGSKAGGELVDAIKSGRFEYEGMVAVIEGSKGSLETTFDGTVDGGYELELAMQNAKMALAEAGGEIGTALTPALQTFSGNILPAATKAVGAMVEGISSAVGWMKEHKGATIAIASVIGILVTAITAYNVVQGIKSAMEAANVTTVWALVAAHWAQFTAAMAALAPYILIVAAIAAVIAIIVVCIKYWDQISAAVVSAAQTCWNAIKAAWEGIVNGISNAVNAVKSVFSTITGWIDANIIQPITGFFTRLWDGFINGAKKAWEGVKSVFSAVGGFFGNVFGIVKDKILSVFSAGGKIFLGIKDGIVSVFKTVVNAIITGINKVISIPFKGLNGILDTISGVSIAGVEPFSWLTWRAPVPQIPMLAQGAYVGANSPMLAVIGDNKREGEFVAPESKLSDAVESAVDRAMAAFNVQTLAAAIEDIANRPIVMNINGRQFALATAGDADSVNGLRTVFQERGLALD